MFRSSVEEDKTPPEKRRERRARFREMGYDVDSDTVEEEESMPPKKKRKIESKIKNESAGAQSGVRKRRTVGSKRAKGNKVLTKLCARSFPQIT